MSERRAGSRVATPGDPLRLGVLASGSGTNLQRIMDACDSGEIPARVVAVVCDKADAFALERARSASIAAIHVDRAAHKDANVFNVAVRDALLGQGVELVVMAGYMRLLGKAVLDAFPDAVLNIHPALLPSFPGAHGIDDAFAYGVKITGVTVHFANEVFDEGPIIAQRAVTLGNGESLESLEARIHEAEYAVYPEAIRLYAEGRLSIEGRRVRVSND